MPKTKPKFSRHFGGLLPKFNKDIFKLFLIILSIALSLALLIVWLGFGDSLGGGGGRGRGRRGRGRTSQTRNSQSQGQSQWREYDNCKLDTRERSESGYKLNNQDGDSFNIICPAQKSYGEFEKEGRLYWVDAPETKIKTYQQSRSSNAKRVTQQAQYFGINLKDDSDNHKAITKIGQYAQSFVKDWMQQSSTFSIRTTMETVFGDPARIYVLVFRKAESGHNITWLHEELIKKGYVRIHTKGAPEGHQHHIESESDSEKYDYEYDYFETLKNLEAKAKANNQGAWNPKIQATNYNGEL